MNKRTESRKGKKVETNVVPFDLRTVPPRGRVDVLAANLIEKFAQVRAPELLPLLEQKREVIHASLNETIGPHAFGFDVQGLLKQAEPFLPMLGFIGGHIVREYMKVEQEKQQKQSGGEGPKAA